MVGRRAGIDAVDRLLEVDVVVLSCETALGVYSELITFSGNKSDEQCRLVELGTHENVEVIVVDSEAGSSLCVLRIDNICCWPGAF